MPGVSHGRPRPVRFVLLEVALPENSGSRGARRDPHKPSLQHLFRRLSAGIVVRVVGCRGRDRPGPPEKASHPGRVWTPNREGSLVTVPLLCGIVSSGAAEVPRLNIGARHTLVAELGEDDRFLTRVGEVLDGGNDVFPITVSPPGGNQVRWTLILTFPVTPLTTSVMVTVHSPGRSLSAVRKRKLPRLSRISMFLP